MMQVKTSGIKRIAKRAFRIFVAALMILQTLWIPNSALAADSAYAFQGYGAENMSSTTLSYATNNASVSGRNVTISPQAGEGEAIAHVALNEGVNDITASVDLGGLEVNFSAVSNITLEGENGLDNDVPSITIYFCSTDDIGSAISSVTLTKQDAAAAGNETLSSGAGIPSGTRSIFVSLKGTNKTDDNTVTFSDVSLSIRDAGAPSCSASYNQDWTNQDVTVTINAADSDAGLEGIYVNDVRMTGTSPYIFTISENNTSFTAYAKDLADKQSEVVTGTIDHIDKTTPAAPSEVPLSSSNWTNADVFVLMPDLGASDGSPERYVYQIGTGAWATMPDGFSITAEGSSTIRVAVEDAAGNRSASAQATAKIDKSAPTISNAEITSGSSSARVDISATEVGSSGLEKFRYAAGTQTADFFTTGGTDIIGSTFTVSVGGDYTIFASDYAGNTTLKQISITTAPTFDPISDVSIDEDTTAHVSLSVFDAESIVGDLSIRVSVSENSVLDRVELIQSESEASLDIIPKANISGGPVTITVEVEDPSGQKVSRSFSVTVNAANDDPVATDDSVTLSEDGMVEIDVLQNDADAADLDTLSISEVGLATNGTTLLVLGKIRYTPNENFVGSDSFTYTISDGNGGTGTATVYVTVEQQNDAPTAVDDTAATAEDAAINIDVLNNDFDVDKTEANPDEAIALLSSGNGAHGTTRIVEGLIEYTPEADFNGTDVFTYQIEDLAGLTSEASVTVTVSPEADAPRFSGLVTEYTIDEDVVGHEISFEIYDVETPQDSLMLQAATLDEELIAQTGIEITGLADETPAVQLLLTPVKNVFGDVNIKLTLGDGFDTVEQTIIIHIVNVNDAPRAGSDTRTYTEDAEYVDLSIASLLAKHSDIDGDAITFDRLVSNPSVGTIQLLEDEATVRYFPAKDYDGTTSFTYYITDGTATTLATCTLEAIGVNDEPKITVSDTPIAGTEDSLVVIPFLIEDNESDPGDLSIIVASGDDSIVTTDGVTIVNNGDGSGEVQIQPQADANGTVNITLTVSDGEAEASGSVDLVLAPAQDAPIAEEDLIYVHYTTRRTFSVLVNDHDVDGDMLSVIPEETTLPGTLTFDEETQTFSYVPVIGENGISTFTYTVTDGHATSSAQVTLDVISETHAPVITAIDSRYISEDGTASGIAFSVSDEDIGDTATISVETSNADLLPVSEGNVTVTDLTGGNYTLTLKPAADQAGSTSVTVTVTDSAALSDSTTFYLYVIGQNDAPVAVDDAYTIDEDNSLALTPIENDLDADGDTCWLSSLTSASHGYIEHTGRNYVYYPYENWSGTETLTYRVSDGRATDEGTITITVDPVNDAPVAWSDWRTLPNDTGAESVDISVLANDYDVDTGDVIRVLDIVTQPTYGNVTINANGTITYTRNGTSPLSNGADSFQYRIIDRTSAEGDYLSATATVYLGVSFHGSLYTYGKYVSCFEDADAFTFDLSVSNPDGINFALTINTPTTLGAFEVVDNDTVRFTPALNQYGYANITYTVAQVGGGASDTGTIWLRVYPVNDLPEITYAPASITMDEDTSAGYTFDVNFHDEDCANSDLYFYVYTQSAQTTAPIPFMASYSTSETTGGRQVTIKTAQNVNGTGKIVVGVSDGMTYDEAVIDLTVTPVDDAPVVQNVNKTTKEDSSVTFASPGSDSEVDGETTTEAIDPDNAPQHGTATINANRTITYVPDADFYGVDTFNVIVTDETTNARSTSATVTITVTAVNDAPEILDLGYYQTVLEDYAKDVTLTVLDVDNDMTASSHYTLTSSDQTLVKSENITIQSLGGGQMVIHVVPEANAYGTLKISILASDGSLSAKGAFSLTIVPVNDPPEVGDDTAEVDEVTSTGAEATPPKTTKLINLLENDTDVEDGQPRIVAITNIVNALSVTNKGSGNVLVTVDGDFSGTVTFSYTVMDRAGAYGYGDVTLTVIAVNDPPRAKNESVTISEDETKLIDVLSNDSDPEGNLLTIDGVGEAAHGTAVISGTKVSYTPDDDYYGTDSFTYTISDGNGGTATATVSVTIKPVNDYPTVGKHSSNADAWVMMEDETKSFHFVVADAESATSNLIIKITSSEQTLVKNTQIALSTNADGYKTIRITPVANAYGDLTLTLWVSDGLLSAQAVIPLSILSVNDAPVVTAPAQTTKEDTQLTASATATDADGDPVKFALETAPLHGTATVREDGSYDYMPALDYNGIDHFTIVADDKQPSNNLGYAIVYINVKPDGDAPIAQDDTITINEDVATTIPVLDNDTDEDLDNGDEITILRATTPAHGTTEITEGGILYTPKSDYNGEDSFQYTITDKDGKLDTASVSITIDPVNDVPRDGDDTATVLEDHSVDIDVTINDDVDETTNPDDEDVIVEFVEQPSHGTASVSTDKKTITYTPDADWFSPEGEPDVFYYTAKDSADQMQTFAVSVTVTSVNDLPIITPETLAEVTTAEDTLSSAITFKVSDIETAAGLLRVTASHLNGVLLPPITVTPDAEGNCSFTVMPNENKVGSTTITVKVEDLDGGQDSAEFLFTVTKVNDAPKPGDDSFTVSENGTYTADVLANDDVDTASGNGGDTLTLLSVETPAYGTATIENNKLYYVPDANRDTSTNYQVVFHYTMKDAFDNECTPKVTVTVTPVNDAPTISAIADVTGVSEDAPNGTGDISFSVTDEEDNDDTLTVSIACDNTTLFPLSNISITNPTGDETGSLRTVKAIPAADQFGTATITLTVRDGQNATATTSFDVTVDSVNDVPLNGDKSFTVVEDVETQLDVLDDIDPDYATTPENITITEIATNPSHGTVRIADDKKSIYYTTAQDSNVPDEFTYTIRDAYGLADYTFTVDITVTPVNDAPVVHYSGPAEYTVYQGTPQENIPFTVTDVDNVTFAGGTEDVEVTLKAKSSNSILLYNGIHIDTLEGDDRDIDLQPYLKWNGRTTVTITATDPGGLEGTASFVLIVNNVNDVPVAVNDAGTIPEDQTSTIYVLTNDTDDDLQTNRDTEFIKINTVTDADPNATITKAADGLSVTVVPNANYNGPVSFTYTIVDAANAESNTATVNLTVSQVNDAPVTQDDTATTDEGTAVDIFVLDNDTDIDKDEDLNASPEDESLSIVLLSATTTHGTISTNGAKITYTPNSNYNGPDSFVYYCSDGDTSIEGNVTLTVYQVNDAPIAVANTTTTLEDTPTALIDVLGNDTDVDTVTSNNLNVLHYKSEFYIVSATVTNTAHGTVEINSNKLKFTPALNWFGSEVINYTMNDGHNLTATSKLTVTVSPVNDPPVFDTAPEDLTLSEDGADGVTTVVVSDIETAAGSLVVTATNSTNPTLVATTDVVVSGTGGTRTITVNPKDNQNGTATITLTVSDGDKTDTEEFIVTVTPVNDAPVATNQTPEIDEDAELQTYTKASLASDVDIATNEDSIALTITKGATHGTAGIDTNGNVTYVPYADFNGTDSFEYTATDDALATAVGTFTITIGQVNDAPTPTDDLENTTKEDTAVDILVLTNDTDIDQDEDLNASPEDEILSVVIESDDLVAPLHGEITTDGTKITYTPDDDYNGTDTFEYYCSDGELMTKATVEIAITQVNDSPTGAIDETTTQEDTPTDWIDVLTNDTDVDLNPDLNEDDLHLRSDLFVRWAEVQGESIGTVEVLNNQLRFTPAQDWFGTAVVHYCVDDSKGGSAITALIITVESINDLPEYTTAPIDLELVEDGSDGTMDIVVGDVETTKDELAVTVTGTTNPTLIDLTDVTVVADENGLRTITVNPKDNQNGTAIIELTLTDKNGGVTTDEFTVTVSPVNDAPVATDKTLEIDEDAELMTFAKALLASDVDIATDDDTINLTITKGASHGTAAIDTYGNVTYIPTANFNGTDSFEYTAEDEAHAKSVGTFSITIEQVNDAPTPTDDLENTTKEDTAVDILVLTNDTDIDQDEDLNVSPEDEILSVVIESDDLVAPLHGEITSDGTKITYTPDDDYNGTDTFEYYCSDGELMTKATVNVAITQVNDSPAGGIDETTTQEDTPTDWIDVLTNDTDVDLNPELNEDDLHLRSDLFVRWATVQGESIGTVEVLNNQLRFTPALNWFGTAVVHYCVDDSKGGSAITALVITVEMLNDPPVFTTEPIDLELVEDGSDGTMDIVVGDPETAKDELAVTVTKTSNPTLIDLTDVTVVADENGIRTITVNPKQDQNGTAVIELTLTDKNGGVTTDEFTVTVSPVNDDPVAIDKTLVINEDAELMTFEKALLASDVDIATNEDSVTLTITKGASHGTAEIDANGNVTYVPYADFNGTDSFEYTAEDEAHAKSIGIFTITIDQVNDAPTPADDLNNTTKEDTAVDILVLTNDDDIDTHVGINVRPGDEILSVVVGVEGLTAPLHGDISTDGTKITYTPDDDYNGADTFDYFCSDGELMTKATVEIAITQVNDNPIANDDSAGTDEDTAVSVDVLENDTDVDTLSELNLDVLYDKADFFIDSIALYGGENGSAEIEGASIRFTPDANFYGTQVIQYVLKDGNGGTSTGKLTILVGSEFDSPNAVDDAMSADEDHTASVNVLTNDTDNDPGDTKTFVKFTELPGVLEGTFDTDANGDVSFTPNENYNGSFEATYQVRDSAGLLDTAKLTVTITPVNDAPVANDGTAETDEDNSKGIDVSSLIGDVDILTNEDAIAVSVAVSGEPMHGTVQVSGTTITYTPDKDFNGTDEITYTVTDSENESDTGKLTITINAVNDAPIAVDDTKTLAEDTATEILVRANDSDIDTDVDINLAPADAPVIWSAGDGLHGVVATDGNTIIYTPHKNYNGTDTIMYVLTDGTEIVTANVQLTITQVNDEIIAEDDTAETNDEDPVTVDVLANDTDVDTDEARNENELHERASFRITAVGEPENGTVSIVSGKIEYTPNDRFAGTDSFTYTVSDGHGETATGTVTITVHSVNDPPVILAVSSPKDGDRAGTGSTVLVEWTSFDIDGDALTYRLEYFDGSDWVLIDNNLTDTDYLFAIPGSLGSVDGLQFRVNARDSEFTSDYGYSGEMLVDQDAPKGTIVTMKTADGNAYTAGVWTNQTVTVVASNSVDDSKVVYYYGMDAKVNLQTNDAGNTTRANGTHTLDSNVTAVTGGTLVPADSMDVVSGVHYVHITAVDEYGNATYVGSYLARVDKQQPAVPDIRESISGGNVVLTLTMNADPGNSGNDKLTLPDGSVVKATGNPTYATPKNGTYSFSLVDVAGNRRNFTYTVTTADTSKPVITLNAGDYRIGSKKLGSINAALSFTDAESEITSRGYMITTGSTASGAYRSYEGALTLSDPGTYYIHAYAKNAFGLTTYETFGPFIVEAPEVSADTATPSPTPAPATGDVIVDKEDVEEIPGDTVSIRIPGHEWSETLTLEDVGPGTYLIEAMDAEGNIRTVEVRVTMRDIIARSLRSNADKITIAAIVVVSVMALCAILLLALLAGHNITIVVNGSQKKLRTFRRIQFKKHELPINLSDKQLAGGTACSIKIAKSLSKNMRGNVVVVTMRGIEVLREQIPENFDEAFKRTIRIAD